MSHTPIPWKFIEPSVDDPGEIVDANGLTIAVTRGRADLDEEASNGRLMTAAPDLLAACEEAAHTLERMTTDQFEVGMDEPIRAKLRAAVAKAKGEN